MIAVIVKYMKNILQKVSLQQKNNNKETTV